MAHNWIQTTDGVVLPCPAYGSSGISISTLVDSGRNVNGKFIGSVIGDDKLKIEMSWKYLTCEQFKSLLLLFDRKKGGKFVQTFEVFDPRENDWVVKEMYVGDRKGRPLLLDEVTGKPTGWLDISANLIEV